MLNYQRVLFLAMNPQQLFCPTAGFIALSNPLGTIVSSTGGIRKPCGEWHWRCDGSWCIVLKIFEVSILWHQKKMGYGLRNATANLPAYSNIISDIHNTGMGMQPAKNDAELRKKPPVGHRWQNPKANHPWSLMEYSVLMGTIFEYSLSELDCWD